MARGLARDPDALEGAPVEDVIAALPLAEAKLAPPRWRPELVERPRLRRALYASAEAALTLVAAPPGYGKTTAVRDWCANQQAAVAWLTIDANDNDPVRLWQYVATAIDGIHKGMGRQALRWLSLPGGSIESPVDDLLNRIVATRTELVLVLDNLQFLTNDDCLESIDYALERLPPTVRVIVMTRSDPALRIPQLRVQGALAELRASDLAFTQEEAHELVVERGHVDLDQEEVATLCDRTGGWPAALSLASLWLHSVDDPHAAVREFGGDHRFVADYLTHEVIGALDDDVRMFLLRASVLGRFTAQLCEDVIGRPDSAALLSELEHSNLFLARLERGGWYRVHPLFGQYAAFQLASLDPEAVPDVHRRAAAWLRSRKFLDEAATHAAAAGDDEFLADLLLEYHLHLIRTGGSRTLLNWAQSLPDDYLVARPELPAAAATAATILGQRFVTRRFMLLVRRAVAERPERRTAYVEALTGMVEAALVADDDVGRSLDEGRRAVEIARAGAEEALIAALAAWARCLYLAGQLDAAWAAAVEAVAHPDAERRPPAHALARSTLALVATERGRLSAARIHAEKAKSLMGGIGSSRTWLGAHASISLGCVLAAEGDLAEAERQLVYAERFLEDEVANIHHAWLLTLLARIRSRRGRLVEAESTLDAARDEVEQLTDGGRVPFLMDDVAAEIKQARARVGGGEVLEPPSDAELAVLRLLATDLSARQIGRRLFLSLNTVRTHMRVLYRKLGVGSRADAVARASSLGLLGPTDSA